MLHAQIVADFDELYKDFRFFYHFWAAHIQKSGKIGDSRLNEIVESQYMYWVRGNRYQIFELEPLKSLLPPHNDVLLELFGVSSAEVIEGLEKLRYSLSQGYADAIMELGKELELFAEAVDSGISPEDARKHAEGRTSKIAGKLHGSDLINVAAITGWDSRFIDMLSYGINECSTFWGESEFAGWPTVGRRHLTDAAAAHFVVLVPGHIYVAAQQIVGHVVLHHQFEQQPAQPVTEHAQRTLQHLLQCARQICARPFGV